MRTIKFRAWIPKEKKMFYQHDQYLGSFIRRAVLFITGTSEHEKYVDGGFEQYLMQFTGLLDKNGKECFEGDIVSRYCEDGKVWVNDIVYVEEEGGFCFHSKYKGGQGWSRMHAGHSMYWWEVIGNTYENPELLTPQDAYNKVIKG